MIMNEMLLILSFHASNYMIPKDRDALLLLRRERADLRRREKGRAALGYLEKKQAGPTREVESNHV